MTSEIVGVDSSANSDEISPIPCAKRTRIAYDTLPNKVTSNQRASNLNSLYELVNNVSNSEIPSGRMLILASHFDRTCEYGGRNDCYRLQLLFSLWGRLKYVTCSRLSSSLLKQQPILNYLDSALPN
ncbi:unnamed protein product [Ixodes pacificus]